MFLVFVGHLEAELGTEIGIGKLGEIFLLTETRGACEHVQSGVFLCKYFLGSILNKTDAHLESEPKDVVHQGRTS